MWGFYVTSHCGPVQPLFSRLIDMAKQMGQNVSLKKYIKANRTTPRETLGSCTSPQAANRYQVTCIVEHTTFDRGMHNRKPLSRKPKDPGVKM